MPENFCERPWIDFKFFQNSDVARNFSRRDFENFCMKPLKNWRVFRWGGEADPPILHSGYAPVSEGISAFLFRAIDLFYSAQREYIWRERVKKIGKPNKAWSILVIFIPTSPTLRGSCQLENKTKAVT